jgi:hypothetical protein
MCCQVNRKLFSDAIATSTELADSGDIAQARSVLQRALAVIEASSSYVTAQAQGTHAESSRGTGAESIAFVDELKQLLTTSLSSDRVYNIGGGRSNMYQTSHTFTRQRSAYTREGSSSINQSQRSMSLQRQASMSRSLSIT